MKEDLILVLGALDQFRVKSGVNCRLFCAGGAVLDSLFLEEIPKDYDIFVALPSSSLSGSINKEKFLKQLIYPLVKASKGMLEISPSAYFEGKYTGVVVDCTLMEVYKIQFIIHDKLYMPSLHPSESKVASSISIPLSRSLIIDINSMFDAISRKQVGETAKESQHTKYVRKINLLKEKYNL